MTWILKNSYEPLCLTTKDAFLYNKALAEAYSKGDAPAESTEA